MEISEPFGDGYFWIHRSIVLKRSVHPRTILLKFNGGLKMRKRIISILVSITAFIILFCGNNADAAQNVKVKLPTFKVTINGEEMNNLYSRYPLITYKDITYFQMTYEGCRYLGLETKWDNKTGLEIIKTDVNYPYSAYDSKTKNAGSYYASKPVFNIKVNGKAINNQKEEYPLLVFRDVTYFPLTWRFGVDEFGWDYHFSSVNGLVIKSQNGTFDTDVKPENIFINNTADSEITTKVTALSQYKYGVAKICVDGRWFFIDKQGNEVSSVKDLSIVNNINISNTRPLIEYKNIEKVDDILLLRTIDDYIQCVDLSTGKILYEGEGAGDYNIDDKIEEPTGHYRTTLGNNQRAIKISKANEEATHVVNVDTKEVLKIYCYRDRIQEGLYQYKENNLFGFKNMYNQVVIPAKHPQSLRNTLFSEGFAIIRKSNKDDKTFVIYDRKGNAVFEIYLDYQDDMSEFSDGLAKIGRKYLYGFIDTTGKVVIEPQYNTATSFSNGIAIVSKNGKYGVINKNNEVLIPLEYDSIGYDSENDRNPNAKRDKYDLNPNYPIVAQKNGKWGYVNFPYPKRVPVEGREGWSYETVEPGPVVPFIYDNYPRRDVKDLPSDYDYTTHSPYAIFRVDEKDYAVGVTLEGKVLTPEGYDSMGYEFEYGLMYVKKDDKIGFLNTDFEFEIPLKYTGIAYSTYGPINSPCFMDDVACVSKGEKLALIDRKGNELLYFN